MINETQDIYRLYVREWVIVHTETRVFATDLGDTFEAARDWATANVVGRVREDEIVLVANTDNQGLFWVHVKVFKDNLKGEYKYAHAAHTYALSQGYEEYTIVPRNSKADHDVRSYGVKRLKPDDV